MLNAQHPPQIAYFCMEFGVHMNLPIYAGGLGVLAGDVLKAARDGDHPLFGIGIFWDEGYTIQRLDDAGQPVDHFQKTPRDLLVPTGVSVTVRIREEDVAITSYWLDAGDGVQLLLLEPVEEQHRQLTRRLYGGGPDDRVAQELILGVGGVRMIRALELSVGLFHFNEGHALFAGFELMRERVAAGSTPTQAREAVRREIVFTTHTPVPAGNEVHPIDRLLQHGVGDLGFGRDFLRELGGDPFEMTPAALRLSTRANAVAQLHGRTAQDMWRHVPDAAPITAITNGVHLPTWQDPKIAELVRTGGPDEVFWEQHQANKTDLIKLIADLNGVHLNPDVLLLGFARRAATYKRATLILRDLDWLRPLLEQGKLQIVFSGKAHPRDEGGKQMVAEVARVAAQFPNQVAFLQAYDMPLGAALTRGCDAWLNNPRRPMEASGTSGMKAAANGLLNVSILDGWWDEACQHGKNGWQIGHRRDDTSDEDDLRALQHVLTHEVLPTYAHRPAWSAMMRRAVHTAHARFSAARMLADYDACLYGPALQDLGRA